MSDPVDGVSVRIDDTDGVDVVTVVRLTPETPGGPEVTVQFASRDGWKVTVNEAVVAASRFEDGIDRPCEVRVFPTGRLLEFQSWAG